MVARGRDNRLWLFFSVSRHSRDDVEEYQVCASIAKDGGACGCVFRKEFGVGVVEIRKERAIFEDGCYFQNVVERCSRVFENARDVGENAPGLRFDIVSDNFIGFRINRGLSRDEDEVAIDYGLRVGEFGDVAAFAGEGLFFHCCLLLRMNCERFNIILNTKK